MCNPDAVISADDHDFAAGDDAIAHEKIHGLFRRASQIND